MPEEQLLKTEESRTRAEIADVLSAAAEQIEAGTVELADATTTREVDIP